MMYLINGMLLYTSGKQGDSQSTYLDRPVLSVEVAHIGRNESDMFG